jgi:hypothetical protein
MKYLNLNSEHAYKFVKEKRTTISPNFNFLGQLYEYEKKQEEMRKSEIGDDESNNSISKSSNITQNETNLLEKKTVINLPCKEGDISIFNLKKKKKFIFNFNDSDVGVTSLSIPSTPNTLAYQETTNSNKKMLIESCVTNSLLSPSQAFSSFNLNSPTNNQVSNIFLKESSRIDSFNLDIEKKTAMRAIDDFGDLKFESKINDDKNLFNKSFNKNDDVKCKQLNSLKRPSSILLNNINDNFGESFVEKAKTIIPRSNEIDTKGVKSQSSLNPLSRTFSNTSSSSTSSSCSFASISSNFSTTLTNSSNSDLNENIQQKINTTNNFNKQPILLKKKIKFSP